MEKGIRVFMLEEAGEFIRELESQVKKQFSKYINRVKEGYRGDWFKKMDGTEGIWEFRVIFNKNCFRLFAFWDSTSTEETLVVCTHGIHKKTNKTPKKRLRRHKKSKNVISANLLNVLYIVFKTKVMSKKIVRNGLVLIPFEELEDEFFGEKGTNIRKQYDFELKLDLIGEALKAARKSRNLTQQELGDMVGVGKAQISKLEKSTGNTTFDTVVRVFNALGAKVKLRIELENDSEVVLQ